MRVEVCADASCDECLACLLEKTRASMRRTRQLKNEWKQRAQGAEQKARDMVPASRGTVVDVPICRTCTADAHVWRGRYEWQVAHGKKRDDAWHAARQELVWQRNELMGVAAHAATPVWSFGPEEVVVVYDPEANHFERLVSVYQRRDNRDMPLLDGCSNEVIAENIRKEVAAGKPPEQAVAIALAHARAQGCNVTAAALRKLRKEWKGNA